MNVEDLNVQQLKNVVENHRRKGATNAPLFREALRELESRTGKGLNFDRSFEAIRAAAKDRRFLSYKDLSDASGAEWTKVHYEVGGHLWRLVEYAHLMGWPMLSAIVVNKPNVSTGSMEPATLKGFVAAARALRIPVTDEQRFLREQQERVFEWGAKQLDVETTYDS